MQSISEATREHSSRALKIRGVKCWEWTLRATPLGVEDLGKVSQAPDVDLVDELFDRVVHGRPIGTLASPDVVTHVRHMVSEARKAWPGPADRFSLGMMGDWKLRRAGGERYLCLDIEDGGTRLFTLVGEGAAARITAVRNLGDGTACN